MKAHGECIFAAAPVATSRRRVIKINCNLIILTNIKYEDDSIFGIGGTNDIIIVCAINLINLINLNAPAL